MEHAVDYALIAALCAVVGLMSFTLLRLFLWMQRPCERGRFEQTGEAVLATVAAQMHRQLDAALAEQRAAHQEEMDVLRRAIAAACDGLAVEMPRKVKAAVAGNLAALKQEMGAIKGAISETNTQMRDEVRSLKADMREMRRSLRVPDEQRPADISGAARSGALVVAPRRSRAADSAKVSAISTDFCSSGTLRVDRHIPADAAAQHTIRHYDPRHSDAAQAGRFAAPGLSAVMRGSHDHHVRVDPTPTPVSGISRDGGAARTKRGSSNPASRAPVGAPVQASFAEAAPVLPVAAAAEALWPRKQRAQDQQRRDPPLRRSLRFGDCSKRRHFGVYSRSQTLCFGV
jgi:hypothetical protein